MVRVFLSALQVYLRCATNLAQISDTQTIIVMACHDIETAVYSLSIRDFYMYKYDRVTSAAAKGFCYVVKKGDTLTSIAKTFKVKLPDLIAANKQCVPNPDELITTIPLV
ncbi:hypothetical protein RCL_jg16558.t1 [Rhizophagus clarus]|uniref:LysM domain-containing protein n=1 Tax=Rhizophagus clarus TaxID=94130 RepID=A0A8H3LHU6_9GLOM|nr:hypothetical protein RCL_jg16558.t1 [Rhizophagus clarus]